MEIPQPLPEFDAPVLLAFIRGLAALNHDGEQMPDGRGLAWELDDAVDTLNDLIREARRVVARTLRGFRTRSCRRAATAWSSQSGSMHPVLSA